MYTNKIAISIGQYFNSPIGNDKNPNLAQATLGQLITNAITASIIGAGVVLLLFIIVGGLRMISNAGNYNSRETAGGKQAVTAAIAGFVIVFIAFWIIQLIEAITGFKFITAPNF